MNDHSITADTFQRMLQAREVDSTTAARLAEILESALTVGIAPRKCVALVREYSARGKWVQDRDLDGAMADVHALARYV